MTETPLTLAGDFTAPSRQDWEAEVLKVLNRRRPEGKELSIEQAMKRLTTITVDDLVIDPLYTRATDTAADHDLGHPGVTPFTRGTSLRTGAIHAWDVTQLHEDPDVAFSNAAVLADSTRGVPMSGESPATTSSSAGLLTPASVRHITAKPCAASCAGEATMRSGKPLAA